MDGTRVDRYEVRSLVRGLEILECVERARAPMRLTDIANELGVERATLYRYCTTLVGLRYLHIDPKTKQYSLGLRVRSMAYAATAQWPSLVLIRDFLPVVAERFRGAASLGVLEGDDVLYVERAVAGQALNFQLSIGDRLPVLRTSMGRVLLAYESDTEIRRALRGIADPDEHEATLKNLHDIHEAGVAVNLGLIQSGLNSVAVPVFEPDATQPFGAINLAGSAEFLTEERLRGEVADALREFSHQIVLAGRPTVGGTSRRGAPKSSTV